MAICAGSVSAEDAPTVSTDELSVLTGEGWAGELIYRAYEPPYEEEAIPAELSEVVSYDNGVRFGIKYPGEDEVNPTEALSVSDDGLELGSAPITQKLAIGESLFVTTLKACTDDGRPAMCERTYQIGARAFTMTKQVELDETGEIFIRNRYAFSR
ncbi:MAG: hypothetical protein CMK07_10940 [Ponticaulis sp.]|nr:hypothetical protein [Ponticaulis sp.]